MLSIILIHLNLVMASFYEIWDNYFRQTDICRLYNFGNWRMLHKLSNNRFLWKIVRKVKYIGNIHHLSFPRICGQWKFGSWKFVDLPLKLPQLPDTIQIYKVLNRYLYCLQVIQESEIIENVEKQLEEISINPSVKLYENFLRRNSSILHIKHYLNLLGEISLSRANKGFIFRTYLAQKRIIGLLSGEVEAGQNKETNKKMSKYCKSFLVRLFQFPRLHSELNLKFNFSPWCHV